MTKEELLTGFETIIGKPDASNNYAEIGISTRTLDTFLGNIGEVDAETATSEWYGKHVEMLKAIGGQMRHDISEAIKSYEAKKPKPNEPPKPKDEPKPDDPMAAILAKLDAMQKANDELRAKVEDNELVNKKKKLRADLIEAMEREGATDEYVLKTTLKGVELDTEKSVEELVKYYIGEYDKEFREARGAGATPRNAQGGNGKGNSELDAFFEKKFKK